MRVCCCCCCCCCIFLSAAPMSWGPAGRVVTMVTASVMVAPPMVMATIHSTAPSPVQALFQVHHAEAFLRVQRGGAIVLLLSAAAVADGLTVDAATEQAGSLTLGAPAGRHGHASFGVALLEDIVLAKLGLDALPADLIRVMGAARRQFTHTHTHVREGEGRKLA